MAAAETALAAWTALSWPACNRIGPHGLKGRQDERRNEARGTKDGGRKAAVVADMLARNIAFILGKAVEEDVKVERERK